jgi:signal transduction histidine kinase
MVDREGPDRDSVSPLLEASMGPGSEYDLDAVLERVLSAALELTGARYAALAILDELGRGLDRLLTRTHERAHAFSPGHQPVAIFLGAPVVVRGERWGNLYVAEKQTGPFTARDEQALVVLAGWAALGIDNARLHVREASRRIELERVVQTLEASATIVRALGDETDIERVVELIVTRGRALVQARAMLMLLFDGDALLVRAEAGEIAGTAVGRRLTLDRLSGRVLAHPTLLRVDDVEDPWGSAGELGVADAKTAMIVPLVYGARDVGVLVAFDRLVGGPSFRAEDEAVVLSFAASAATALATAQSVERELLRHSIESAEHERGRWARALHDATLQSLGALALSLSSARVANDPKTLDRAVSRVIEQLVREIATLRALITDLRPIELDDVGIVPALEALVDRCSALYDFAIVLEIDLEHVEALLGSRLVPEAETAIYRTVQEAIRNAAKHAGASTVRVTVEDSGGLIRVTIDDDGRGFAPSARSEGFGLVGLRERATLAGGRLEVKSSSEGTQVRIELSAVPRDVRAAIA